MKRVILIVLGIALLLSAGSAIWVFASQWSSGLGDTK
jgi:hypothetical protein